MKIKDYQRLSFFSNIDVTIVNEPKEEPYSPSDSDLMDIFREIYSVDPESGLPKGDLQYYLSSDGNPQLKAWLETNLLAPRAASSGSSIKDLSDDMIAEFTPMSGESKEDYAARLSSIRDTALADIEKFKSQLSKE